VRVQVRSLQHGLCSLSFPDGLRLLRSVLSLQGDGIKTQISCTATVKYRPFGFGDTSDGISSFRQWKNIAEASPI